MLSVVLGGEGFLVSLKRTPQIGQNAQFGSFRTISTYCEAESKQKQVLV